LNADGVPAPRGTSWNASTINGSRQRCNGIIQNGLYAGKIVWNKVRMVKHPVTGRRISRPNPREEWIEHERTDLAIVDPKVFGRANALKIEKGNLRPEQSKRNVHIFSGLLKCGCCGSGLATAGVDKSKRIRVRCSRHAESRTCPDPRTYYLPWIESTVLAALGKELRERKAINEAVALYRNGQDAHREAARKRYSEAEVRLKEVEAELDRLTDLLARGVGDPIRLDQRSQQARIEECQLRAELMSLDDAEDDLEIRTATMTDYITTVRDLRASVKRGTVDADSPAVVKLQRLVKSVILVPASDEAGVIVEINGRLRSLCRKPKRGGPSGGTMVAEEGFSWVEILDFPQFSIRVPLVAG